MLFVRDEAVQDPLPPSLCQFQFEKAYAASFAGNLGQIRWLEAPPFSEVLHWDVKLGQFARCLERVAPTGPSRLSHFVL